MNTSTKIVVASLLSLLACRSAHAEFAFQPGELIAIRNDKDIYMVRYNNIYPEGYQYIMQLEQAANAGNRRALQEYNTLVPQLLQRYPETKVTILGAAVPSDARGLNDWWRKHMFLPGRDVYVYLQNGSLQFSFDYPNWYDPEKPHSSTMSSGTYTTDLSTPGYQGAFGNGGGMFGP